MFFNLIDVKYTIQGFIIIVAAYASGEGHLKL